MNSALSVHLDEIAPESGIKNWLKVTFWVFKGNFYYTQNGADAAFLSSKSTFFKFPLNLFISFFRNCD